MSLINKMTKLAMSSKEIADLTGKEHKTVLRDIRNMLDALGIDGTDLYHLDGRGYTSHADLDKDLTLTLVTGYNAKDRFTVIRRWRELEEKEAGAPLSTVDLLRMVAAKIEAQSATQPAVYAYAMWVSTEFFMAVVQCITHVVNGDIEQAVRRSTGERAPDHMGRECRIIGNRVAC